MVSSKKLLRLAQPPPLLLQLHTIVYKVIGQEKARWEGPAEGRSPTLAPPPSHLRCSPGATAGAAAGAAWEPWLHPAAGRHRPEGPTPGAQGQGPRKVQDGPLGSARGEPGLLNVNLPI